MSIFIGILLFSAVVFVGCYFYRSLKKGEGISLDGFWGYFWGVVSKIGKKGVSHELDNFGCNAKGAFPPKTTQNNDLFALEEQYQSVLQEKNRLEGLLIAKETEWGMTRTYLTQELEAIQGKLSLLETKNANLIQHVAKLKDVAKKLYPVSENEIAEPYCQYFHSVDELASAFFNDIVDIMTKVSVCNNPMSIGALTSSVKLKESLDKSIVKDWIILLSVSSAVTAEAAKDIELKDDEEIFGYLKRVSFERYFRPLISSLFYFAESVREIADVDIQNQVSLRVKEFLEVLHVYDIEIVYCKSGEIVEGVDYDDYEIRISDSLSEEALASNTITKVIKYGVNAPRMDCRGDKTIIEMVV